MAFPISRRQFLAIGSGATAAAALPGRFAAPAFGAPSRPAARATTPHERLDARVVAPSAATKSDRRPMAGGVYDPRSQQTFISWIGAASHPYVAAYSHVTGLWSAPRRVGTSPFPDAHNYPAMVQADDGALLVFHGAHNSTQRVARSSPHSVDGPWTDAEIPLAAFSSYPMPVKSDFGDIYLFYRQTSQFVDEEAFTDDRPVLYLVSRDNGRTWVRGAPDAPWAIGSAGRADNLNEVYLGQVRHTSAHGRSPERFHLVWTLAGGGPEVHEHDRYHRNLYYAAFHPDDEHFYNAAGTDLGTWIDGETMEAATKAVHSELERAKPLSRDIGYTHVVGEVAGRPLLVFNTQDADTKVINSAVWSGGDWSVHELGRDLGLLELEQVNPAITRLYMVPRDQPVGVQTYLLRSGRTWTAEQRIPTSSAITRASLIPGAEPQVRLILTARSAGTEVPEADVCVIGAH
ncbi:BNR-4 repeat-containing protein [Occultella gossypii]|uniref:BNR-4 repeat-containing protein n=1 Tax=Occultella gossypii TaxID=2800820 RepID=A0ABS7SFA0_9MICO|nr:BNR-4 repeat-containing protein [Occultella gossypii]MBZ2198747.1 BNR-4 repeat-containing protein [Occultella gossypii]